MSFLSGLHLIFEFQKNIRAKIWRFDGSIQRSESLRSVRVNFLFLQCKTFVREREREMEVIVSGVVTQVSYYLIYSKMYTNTVLIPFQIWVPKKSSALVLVHLTLPFHTHESTSSMIIN